MDTFIYAVISNIPIDFRAADLRAHFSSLVEQGHFICFHYRHRPQKNDSCTNSPSPNTEKIDEPCTFSNANELKALTKSDLPLSRKYCCVVKIYQSNFKELVKLNNSHWTKVDGHIFSDCCRITPLTVKPTDRPKPNSNKLVLNNRLKNESQCEQFFKNNQDLINEDILLAMPELNPPPLMPNGNVGTPTLVFLDLIQQCLLPQSLIDKLQLKFPKTSAKRIYGNVNFQYDANKWGSKDHKFRFEKNVFLFPKTRKNLSYIEKKRDDETNSCNKQLSKNSKKSMSADSDSPHNVNIEKNKCECHLNPTLFYSVTGNCQNLTPSNKQVQNLTKREKKRIKKKQNEVIRNLKAEGIEERLISLENSYYDEDAAEEWDRHEACEDDPSNQERNKERLFDEEIEQPWEKGGAGVNFYTDAVYWHEQEGDFDEQTADDLDVDFSAYEETGAGDKDIKDFLKIRQETRFRNGFDDTDRFSIGIGRKLTVNNHSENIKKNTGLKDQTIGAFEQYSKGIGRKIMEKQGWKDGAGLGSLQHGITSALCGEGQSGINKRGLGYVPESRIVYGSSKIKKSRNTYHITTVYDNPNETDSKEPLLQRGELSVLKHRESHMKKF